MDRRLRTAPLFRDKARVGKQRAFETVKIRGMTRRSLRRSSCLTLGLALALPALPGLGAANEPAFELLTLESPGRTVAAEFADLDGDGRTDLLQIVYVGVPPKETREIRVYLQSADGAVGPEPSFAIPMPAGGAAYDLGDLLENPGEELVLLRRDGVTILSLAQPTGARRGHSDAQERLGLK